MVSHGVTLEAGSIFLTGSPVPLNRAIDPSPWIKHGDDVRVFVEGCGQSLWFPGAQLIADASNGASRNPY